MNTQTSKVVQHNHWSGKNCPRNLRSGSKGVTWKSFINKVKGGESLSKPVETQKKPSEVEQRHQKTNNKKEMLGGIAVKGQIQIVNVKNAAYICDEPSSTKSKNLDTARKGSKWSIVGSIPGWYEILWKNPKTMKYQRAYLNQKFAKRV